MPDDCAHRVDSSTAVRIYRSALTSAGALALIVVLAGCLSSVSHYVAKVNRQDSATGDLENFIQTSLTTKFHRHVRTVHCTPFVDEVTIQSTATVTCVVRFADGTSYTTDGSVTNPSEFIDYSNYTYSYGDPPGYDVTTAPLPTPIVTLAATSPRSLLRAHNLTAALTQITGKLGARQLILRAAVYPGELQIVLGANGDARLVTVSDDGSLIAGGVTAFEGSRSGIAFSQLVPKVVQGLASEISSKGGLPLADIGHFTLITLPGDNAGWAVYPVSGPDRFQSYVLGDRLQQTAPVHRSL